ncbi:MAG TPA: SUF system NifU family Fe-S cluster assembly protein [Nitriliruptorales bacterium]|nr:SUF system NifU family Fe-S cluster assembly protein [Nitriliruptorales bacterium]
MTLDDLYQQIILEHYRSPKNRAPALEGEDVHVHHSNPLCGDELDLRVDVEDGRVQALVFDGDGCSISQASASVMTETVKGRDLGDALDLAEQFRLMMHGQAPTRMDDLGDGVVFQGVAKFPVRVKCALLGWMALRDALETFQAGESEHRVTCDAET